MTADTRELPAGWCSTDLGSLGKYLNGRGFKSSEWAERGRPIIRIQNLTGSSAKFNYFQGEVDPKHEVAHGDLLMSWAATLGAYVWRGPSAVLNQHIFKVESYVDRAFHYYALQWVLEALYRNAHGSGMVHITKAKFDGTPVLLPPAPEQHRIVEAIESYFTRLDDAVATLERVQRNLKRYRASVLKAAVEGRLVPTEAEMARAEGRDYEPASVLLERILAERRRRWEEAELAKMKAKGKTPKDDRWKANYKEPAAPDTAGMPPLPEGWCCTTAEALSDETRSITYGVVKLGAETPDGVPTLRSSNVRHLRLELGHVKKVSEKISAAYQRTVLGGGEILITVRGTLGGVIAVPSSCAGFNISREVAMIALVEPRIAPLIATFIGSSVLQNWLMSRTRGIAYTGVNIATLKTLPVPVPPLEEQARIVEAVEHHLSIGGASESACVANGQRCTSLRQSILKWAFEGRLVDQDPTDEPASVLLDRIRAEREAAPVRRSRSPRRARPRRGVRG